MKLKRQKIKIKKLYDQKIKMKIKITKKIEIIQKIKIVTKCDKNMKIKSYKNQKIIHVFKFVFLGGQPFFRLGSSKKRPIFLIFFLKSRFPRTNVFN